MLIKYLSVAVYTDIVPSTHECRSLYIWVSLTMSAAVTQGIYGCCSRYNMAVAYGIYGYCSRYIYTYTGIAHDVEEYCSYSVYISPEHLIYLSRLCRF